jgi:hypothetical protein
VDEFHCSTVLRPQALVAEDPAKHGEGPGLGRRGAEPSTCLHRCMKTGSVRRDAGDGLGRKGRKQKSDSVAEGGTRSSDVPLGKGKREGGDGRR